MNPKDDTYTLVVPVFNSGKNLFILVKDFKELLLNNGFKINLILVDDASNEETRNIAEQLTKINEFVSTIRLKTNSGQVAATTCGIHSAEGNAIITMDDDLQYPMREVVKLIEFYQKSNKKIIFGYPVKRMHSFKHRLAAQLVILLFDFLVLPRYRNVNFYTTFRIFSRSLFFDTNNSKIDRHLFYVWDIPVSEMDSIPVEHQTRKNGKSTYTFLKIIHTLLPPILFCVSRISLYCFLLLALITIALMIAGLSYSIFFYLIITGCIFSLILIPLSKNLLQNKRRIKYEIEKITK
ncbi:MAG: glycosyltransferase [Chitinophagales bacterium]|mgnify:CR=1 FL=1|nr:glycosyltransferase [Chitinophagales bacterium]